MSSRIIVSPKAAESPTAPASSYDLGQKVRAAVAAGVFVAIGLTVAAGVLLLPSGRWEAWLWSAGVALVAGVLATCWLGFQWVKAAASRPWLVDDKIRQRIWKREDAEQAAAKAAEKEIRRGPLDHDKDPATTSDIQRLHLVAIEVLRRHYVDDLPVTREVMEKEGVKQEDWNKVNKLLLAVGLKRGYTLRPDLDFQTAWGAWQSSVFLDTDHAWVKTGQGQEVRVELPV